MAETTELDMVFVVLLRHEGMLGDMNLCGSPAITCAQHPAQHRALLDRAARHIVLLCWAGEWPWRDTCTMSTV